MPSDLPRNVMREKMNFVAHTLPQKPTNVYLLDKLTYSLLCPCGKCISIEIHKIQILFMGN